MKHSPSPDDDVGRALRRAMSDPVPPNQVSDAAIALWRKTASEASPLGRLVRVLAQMVFDSTMHSPAALGMRSAGTHAPIRHLLFSAEGRDIDLRISADPAATPDRWTIGGQVLGPDAAGQVTAERAGAESLRTVLDAMGEFSVVGLPAGRYVVTLRCSRTEIVLPPIEVGGDA